MKLKKIKYFNFWWSINSSMRLIRESKWGAMYERLAIDFYWSLILIRILILSSALLSLLLYSTVTNLLKCLITHWIPVFGMAISHECIRKVLWNNISLPILFGGACISRIMNTTLNDLFSRLSHSIIVIVTIEVVI